MGYFWFTKKFNRNIHNKNYNNVQNEKKQKQTKNRAKINEKIPMKKKDHLPYTNIVGKKRKKKVKWNRFCATTKKYVYLFISTDYIRTLGLVT